MYSLFIDDIFHELQPIRSYRSLNEIIRSISTSKEFYKADDTSANVRVQRSMEIVEVNQVE